MTPSPLRRNYSVAAEHELLSWARDGDQRAFAELATQSAGKVRSVCARIVGDSQLAEDAMQNTFLAAWQNLSRFEARSRFSTWLCQIAHNASLVIAKRRTPEPTEKVPDRPGRARPPGTAETVADVHAVRWAIALLPPDFRAALVLREYGELTYAEIAEAQGVPLDTVKSRIARARQGLVALLDEGSGATANALLPRP